MASYVKKSMLINQRVCRSIQSYPCVQAEESPLRLKAGPTQWYDMLSSFLLSQKFFKGDVDPTLFTRKEGKDILMEKKYALEILKKYGMDSSDSVDTPMVDKTKLDKDLQGRIVNPTHYHGLWYSKDTSIALTAYADADHARCQDTRRSTFGNAQFLGDRLVSWSSKKQKSTTIFNYGFEFNKILMYYDNKSAISLCCNNVQHSRLKHIDVRYHFIKEQVKNGVVELYFVRTEYQLADIFTKELPRERFKILINKLGMKTMSPETLKSLAEEMKSDGGTSSCILDLVDFGVTIYIIPILKKALYLLKKGLLVRGKRRKLLRGE
ncbi:hypothetical protein Tco_0551313 [Tanacetum coccineum]